jgi:hypothetical protein
MTRFRVLFILFLALAPFLFLMGAGGYHLWQSGWMFWAWWPMMACLALASFFGWYWTRRAKLPAATPDAPGYWTERDTAAWQRVLAKAKSFESVTVEQIQNPQHYSDVAIDLAKQVAELYNPNATDPFDHLTLPEILACVELAAEDLDELVQKYVPGSHMLRIRDLKRARQAVGYYNTATNAYWAGAAIINPLQTALRYAASKLALGTLIGKLQNNVLLWFHNAFIERLGRYLIELNSGRLKVGAKRYRELLAQHQTPPVESTPPAQVSTLQIGDAIIPATPASPTAAPAVHTIRVMVLGAVKAGKSSLVNAILGRTAATVDRVPVPGGTQYDFTLSQGQPIRILDSTGYGQDGPNDADFAEAVDAARDADLILLVTHATNPGRQTDVILLARLRDWFATQPQFKMPPVLCAVTHIDLLSPKAEWQPPYDWQSGTRAKEANIRDCVNAVKEQLGTHVTGVVPVCALAESPFGVTEFLLPAIAAQVDQAHGTALTKALEQAASEGKYQKIAEQTVEAGKQLFGAIRDAFKRK